MVVVGEEGVFSIMFGLGLVFAVFSSSDTNSFVEILLLLLLML